MSFAAIQTFYKGHRFRSRLEARWAVFFDALEIEWLYEPQGFIREADEVFAERICYLPDFYLPELGFWVEVKGAFNSDSAKRLAQFLDWGSPLPNFANSFEHPGYKGGLLLLGEIPKGVSDEEKVVFHKLITHQKGLLSCWSMFGPRYWTSKATKLYSANFDSDVVAICGLFAPPKIFEQSRLDAFDPDDHIVRFFDSAPLITYGSRAYEMIGKAYDAALSARFEHGESGVN